MSKKNHVRRQAARDRKAQRRNGKGSSGRGLSQAMREASAWPVYRCAMGREDGDTALLLARESHHGEIVAAGFVIHGQVVTRALPVEGGGITELESLTSALSLPLSDCEPDEALSLLEDALQSSRSGGVPPPAETWALRMLFG